MADSREIGMRIGAATNQAVSVAVSVIDQLGGDPTQIGAYVEELASTFLGVMDKLQAKAQGLTPTPAAAYVAAAPTVALTAAFPGSTYVAPQAPQAAQAVQAVPNTNGYNTEFSGSSRPLKLAEHPELDGWLHAQAAAKGVSEVWDNRGKPAYIAAIQSGAVKTPPPFRSATDGVDASFWPPSAR